MGDVTSITKSQQQTCKDFLQDVLNNADEIQPKAALVLLVTESDPSFLILSDSGLSLEGAIAMIQAGNLELVKKVSEG